jgi:PTS system fructose-specific IIC component
MSLLRSRLTKESIQLHLKSQSKEELLSQMANHLCHIHSLKNCKEILEKIEERESNTSTYLGDYCAIPHAHLTSLDDTKIVAATISHPLAWNNEEDKVSVVFLLVGPPKNATIHLRLLSQLVRILHDETIRESLIHSQSQEEFFSHLFSNEE